MYSEMEISILSVLFCFYIAYITYFFVPVHGPRFFLENLHTVPLTGILLSEHIYNLIDFLETNKFDCFPSLHTAVLLVAMYISYRFWRKFFWYNVPLALGILFSLVYLRYHYVIDMIAGAIYAAASCYLMNQLYKMARNKFIPHFVKDYEKNN